MKKVLLTISLLVCYYGSIYAQEHEHNEHCNHEHRGHEHSRNEIGFSGGVLYGFGHNEWGSGLHLHYFRTLKPNSKWALGGGIEQAWVDGSHFNVGVGAKYQIFDRLSISTLPGVSFFSHKETDVLEAQKALFTLHFELVYDIFHWEKFHLGAVADYSLTKIDRHGMLGIHAAYCF